jgi:uncharacterized OB-fold protein
MFFVSFFQKRNTSFLITERGKMADSEMQLRPAPVFTPDSAFFWRGAKDGTLLIQRCCHCAKLWHPPRPMCPACYSVKLEPHRMSGRGTVYSWALPIHPPPHGFAMPPVVALIDLEEGPRIVSNVRGVDPCDMCAGLLVEVEFEAAEDGMAVPVFRPRPQETS